MDRKGDHFIKRLLLFAGTDLLIVIFDHTILPLLFGIKLRERRIKQLVIHLSYVGVAVFDIERCTIAVNIFSDVAPAVMGNHSRSGHGTDGSLHTIIASNSRPYKSILPFAASAAGFVTFSKSNAKALLTAEPSKAHLRPTGWKGLCPVACGQLPSRAAL